MGASGDMYSVINMTSKITGKKGSYSFTGVVLLVNKCNAYKSINFFLVDNGYLNEVGICGGVCCSLG
jgi:hypothetical protein